MRILLTSFTLMFVLVGCSSAPTVVSPVGLAAYETLAADTQLRYWVDACQKQNSTLRQQAQSTYQSWWQRNASYIEAADFGLAYGILRVTEDRVDTGARLAMGMTWNMTEQAELDLVRRFVPENADKICSEVLTQYQRGDFDISKKNFEQEFKDLQRFQEAKQDELLRRQAFLATKTGKEYGRSYYVVEKMLQKENCPIGQINLIKSAWPHEVYEANCASQGLVLMQCEWSSCRKLQ